MKRLILISFALTLSMVAFAQPDRPQTQSVRVIPRPDNDLNVRIWTQNREYRIGENIQIYYRTSRDAYVLVFSTDANGETRQLLPNSYDSQNFTRGGVTYSIPNRGYSLEVSPPTGRETLSIVAFRERNQILDTYSARKSEVFPRSQGPRAAISRVIVRPDDSDRNRRYAEASTTIQVNGRWSNGPGNGYPGNGPGSGYPGNGYPGNGPGSGYPGSGYPGNGPGSGYPGDNDRGYGRLTIKSDPGAAYVYIDRQYRGITPLDLQRISAGYHNITINRAGYYPVRKRVRVNDDERTRINEDLRLIRY